MKMYCYGLFIFNSSGGYKDIEDKIWMEFVWCGEIRSLFFVDNLFKVFENYELNILNFDIDKLFIYLLLIKWDDIDNYLKKINN